MSTLEIKQVFFSSKRFSGLGSYRVFCGVNSVEEAAVDIGVESRLDGLEEGIEGLESRMQEICETLSGMAFEQAKLIRDYVNLVTATGAELREPGYRTGKKQEYFGFGGQLGRNF